MRIARIYTGDDRRSHFHAAPRRQRVITPSGRLQVECGDATMRELGPGDVLLTDDLSGQGHISRAIEAPRASIAVPVPAGLDLDALRA